MHSKYMHEMLRLSGLSEAYLDPDKNNIWNNQLHTIAAQIQGTLSSLSQAIEALTGWIPPLIIQTKSLEDFGLDNIKALDKSLNILNQTILRSRYVAPGSKFFLIGKTFKTLKDILNVFHDIVLRKKQILEFDDLDTEMQNLYRQHIEPLLLFSKELLDKSYSVENKY